MQGSAAEAVGGHIEMMVEVAMVQVTGDVGGLCSTRRG